MACFLGFLAAGLVAPGGELPLRPADLVGVYDGFRGDGGDVYRVLVTEDGPGGRLLGTWVNVATGRTDYCGVFGLVRHDDGWEYRETYLTLPGLFACVPWQWRLVNRTPVSFEHAGWRLQRQAR